MIDPIGRYPQFVSGQIYYNPIRGEYFALMFNDGGWSMLHLAKHIMPGLTAPAFQHDEKGTFIFSKQTLLEKWNAAEWHLLGARLAFVPSDSKYKHWLPEGLGGIERQAAATRRERSKNR